MGRPPSNATQNSKGQVKGNKKNTPALSSEEEYIDPHVKIKGARGRPRTKTTTDDNIKRPRGRPSTKTATPKPTSKKPLKSPKTPLKPSKPFRRKGKGSSSEEEMSESGDDDDDDTDVDTDVDDTDDDDDDDSSEESSDDSSSDDKDSGDEKRKPNKSLAKKPLSSTSLPTTLTKKTTENTKLTQDEHINTDINPKVPLKKTITTTTTTAAADTTSSVNPPKTPQSSHPRSQFRGAHRSEDPFGGGSKSGQDDMSEGDGSENDSNDEINSATQQKRQKHQQKNKFNKFRLSEDHIAMLKQQEPDQARDGAIHEAISGHEGASLGHDQNNPEDQNLSNRHQISLTTLKSRYKSTKYQHNRDTLDKRLDPKPSKINKNNYKKNFVSFTNKFTNILGEDLTIRYAVDDLLEYHYDSKIPMNYYSNNIDSLHHNPFFQQIAHQLHPSHHLVISLINKDKSISPSLAGSNQQSRNSSISRSAMDLNDSDDDEQGEPADVIDTDLFGQLGQMATLIDDNKRRKVQFEKQKNKLLGIFDENTLIDDLNHDDPNNIINQFDQLSYPNNSLSSNSSDSDSDSDNGTNVDWKNTTNDTVAFGNRFFPWLDQSFSSSNHLVYPGEKFKSARGIHRKTQFKKVVDQTLIKAIQTSLFDTKEKYQKKRPGMNHLKSPFTTLLPPPPLLQTPPHLSSPGFPSPLPVLPQPPDDYDPTDNLQRVEYESSIQSVLLESKFINLSPNPHLLKQYILDTYQRIVDNKAAMVQMVTMKKIFDNYEFIAKYLYKKIIFSQEIDNLWANLPLYRGLWSIDIMTGSPLPNTFAPSHGNPHHSYLPPLSMFQQLLSTLTQPSLSFQQPNNLLRSLAVDGNNSNGLSDEPRNDSLLTSQSSSSSSVAQIITTSPLPLTSLTRSRPIRNTRSVEVMSNEPRLSPEQFLESQKLLFLDFNIDLNHALNTTLGNCLANYLLIAIGGGYNMESNHKSINFGNNGNKYSHFFNSMNSSFSSSPSFTHSPQPSTIRSDIFIPNGIITELPYLTYRALLEQFLNGFPFFSPSNSFHSPSATSNNQITNYCPKIQTASSPYSVDDEVHQNSPPRSNAIPPFSDSSFQCRSYDFNNSELESGDEEEINEFETVMNSLIEEGAFEFGTNPNFASFFDPPHPTMAIFPAYLSNQPEIMDQLQYLLENNQKNENDGSFNLYPSDYGDNVDYDPDNNLDWNYHSINVRNQFGIEQNLNQNYQNDQQRAIIQQSLRNFNQHITNDSDYRAYDSNDINLSNEYIKLCERTQTRSPHNLTLQYSNFDQLHHYHDITSPIATSIINPMFFIQTAADTGITSEHQSNDDRILKISDSIALASTISTRCHDFNHNFYKKYHQYNQNENNPNKSSYRPIHDSSSFSDYDQIANVSLLDANLSWSEQFEHIDEKNPSQLLSSIYNAALPAENGINEQLCIEKTLPILVACASQLFSVDSPFEELNCDEPKFDFEQRLQMLSGFVSRFNQTTPSEINNNPADTDNSIDKKKVLAKTVKIIKKRPPSQETTTTTNPSSPSTVTTGTGKSQLSSTPLTAPFSTTLTIQPNVQSNAIQPTPSTLFIGVDPFELYNRRTYRSPVNLTQFIRVGFNLFQTERVIQLLNLEIDELNGEVKRLESIIKLNVPETLFSQLENKPNSQDRDDGDDDQRLVKLPPVSNTSMSALSTTTMTDLDPISPEIDSKPGRRAGVRKKTGPPTPSSLDDIDSEDEEQVRRPAQRIRVGTTPSPTITPKQSMNLDPGTAPNQFNSLQMIKTSPLMISSNLINMKKPELLKHIQNEQQQSEREKNLKKILLLKQQVDLKQSQIQTINQSLPSISPEAIHHYDTIQKPICEMIAKGAQYLYLLRPDGGLVGTPFDHSNENPEQSHPEPITPSSPCLSPQLQLSQSLPSFENILQLFHNVSPQEILNFNIVQTLITAIKNCSNDDDTIVRLDDRISNRMLQQDSYKFIPNNQQRYLFHMHPYLRSIAWQPYNQSLTLPDEEQNTIVDSNTQQSQTQSVSGPDSVNPQAHQSLAKCPQYPYHPFYDKDKVSFLNFDNQPNQPPSQSSHDTNSKDCLIKLLHQLIDASLVNYLKDLRAHQSYQSNEGNLPQIQDSQPFQPVLQSSFPIAKSPRKDSNHFPNFNDGIPSTLSNSLIIIPIQQDFEEHLGNHPLDSSQSDDGSIQKALFELMFDQCGSDEDQELFPLDSQLEQGDFGPSNFISQESSTRPDEDNEHNMTTTTSTTTTTTTTTTTPPIALFETKPGPGLNLPSSSPSSTLDKHWAAAEMLHNQLDQAFKIDYYHLFNQPTFDPAQNEGLGLSDLQQNYEQHFNAISQLESHLYHVTPLCFQLCTPPRDQLTQSAPVSPSFSTALSEFTPNRTQNYHLGSFSSRTPLLLPPPSHESVLQQKPFAFQLPIRIPYPETVLEMHKSFTRLLYTTGNGSEDIKPVSKMLPSAVTSSSTSKSSAKTLDSDDDTPIQPRTRRGRRPAITKMGDGSSDDDIKPTGRRPRGGRSGKPAPSSRGRGGPKNRGRGGWDSEEEETESSSEEEESEDNETSSDDDKIFDEYDSSESDDDSDDNQGRRDRKNRAIIANLFEKEKNQRDNKSKQIANSHGIDVQRLLGMISSDADSDGEDGLLPKNQSNPLLGNQLLDDSSDDELDNHAHNPYDFFFCQDSNQSVFKSVTLPTRKSILYPFAKDFNWLFQYLYTTFISDERLMFNPEDAFKGIVPRIWWKVSVSSSSSSLSRNSGSGDGSDFTQFYLNYIYSTNAAVLADAQRLNMLPLPPVVGPIDESLKAFMIASGHPDGSGQSPSHSPITFPLTVSELYLKWQIIYPAKALSTRDIVNFSPLSDPLVKKVLTKEEYENWYNRQWYSGFDSNSPIPRHLGLGSMEKAIYKAEELTREHQNKYLMELEARRPKWPQNNDSKRSSLLKIPPFPRQTQNLDTCMINPGDQDMGSGGISAYQRYLPEHLKSFLNNPNGEDNSTSPMNPMKTKPNSKIIPVSKRKSTNSPNDDSFDSPDNIRSNLALWSYNLSEVSQLTDSHSTPTCSSPSCQPNRDNGLQTHVNSRFGPIQLPPSRTPHDSLRALSTLYQSKLMYLNLSDPLRGLLLQFVLWSIKKIHSHSHLRIQKTTTPKKNRKHDNLLQNYGLNDTTPDIGSDCPVSTNLYSNIEYGDFDQEFAKFMLEKLGTNHDLITSIKYYVNFDPLYNQTGNVFDPKTHFDKKYSSNSRRTHRLVTVPSIPNPFSPPLATQTMTSTLTTHNSLSFLSSQLLSASNKPFSLKSLSPLTPHSTHRIESWVLIYSTIYQSYQTRFNYDNHLDQTDLPLLDRYKKERQVHAPKFEYNLDLNSMHSLPMLTPAMAFSLQITHKNLNDHIKQIQRETSCIHDNYALSEIAHPQRFDITTSLRSNHSLIKYQYAIQFPLGLIIDSPMLLWWMTAQSVQKSYLRLKHLLQQTFVLTFDLYNHALYNAAQSTTDEHIMNIGHETPQNEKESTNPNDLALPLSTNPEPNPPKYNDTRAILAQLHSDLTNTIYNTLQHDHYIINSFIERFAERNQSDHYLFTDQYDDVHHRISKNRLVRENGEDSKKKSLNYFLSLKPLPSLTQLSPAPTNPTNPTTTSSNQLVVDSVQHTLNHIENWSTFFNQTLQTQFSPQQYQIEIDGIYHQDEVHDRNDQVYQPHSTPRQNQPDQSHSPNHIQFTFDLFVATSTSTQSARMWSLFWNNLCPPPPPPQDLSQRGCQLNNPFQLNFDHNSQTFFQPLVPNPISSTHSNNTVKGCVPPPHTKSILYSLHTFLMHYSFLSLLFLQLTVIDLDTITNNFCSQRSFIKSQVNIAEWLLSQTIGQRNVESLPLFHSLTAIDVDYLTMYIANSNITSYLSGTAPASLRMDCHSFFNEETPKQQTTSSKIAPSEIDCLADKKTVTYSIDLHPFTQIPITPSIDQCMDILASPNFFSFDFLYLPRLLSFKSSCYNQLQHDMTCSPDILDDNDQQNLFDASKDAQSNDSDSLNGFNPRTKIPPLAHFLARHDISTNHRSPTSSPVSFLSSSHFIPPSSSSFSQSLFNSNPLSASLSSITQIIVESEDTILGSLRHSIGSCVADACTKNTMPAAQDLQSLILNRLSPMISQYRSHWDILQSVSDPILDGNDDFSDRYQDNKNQTTQDAFKTNLSSDQDLNSSMNNEIQTINLTEADQSGQLVDLERDNPNQDFAPNAINIMLPYASDLVHPLVVYGSSRKGHHKQQTGVQGVSIPSRVVQSVSGSHFSSLSSKSFSLGKTTPTPLLDNENTQEPEEYPTSMPDQMEEDASFDWVQSLDWAVDHSPNLQPDRNANNELISQTSANPSHHPSLSKPRISDSSPKDGSLSEPHTISKFPVESSRTSQAPIKPAPKKETPTESSPIKPSSQKPSQTNPTITAKVETPLKATLSATRRGNSIGKLNQSTRMDESSRDSTDSDSTDSDDSDEEIKAIMSRFERAERRKSNIPPVSKGAPKKRTTVKQTEKIKNEISHQAKAADSISKDTDINTSNQATSPKSMFKAESSPVKPLNLAIISQTNLEDTSVSKLIPTTSKKGGRKPKAEANKDKTPAAPKVKTPATSKKKGSKPATSAKSEEKTIASPSETVSLPQPPPTEINQSITHKSSLAKAVSSSTKISNQLNLTKTSADKVKSSQSSGFSSATTRSQPEK